MQDLITALEDSAIATFVRESPSIFAYTTVLSLHAMGLAVVVGVSLVIALRLLGGLRAVPVANVLKLYPLMYVGFTVNAISGLMLFAANASGMLSNAAFLTKMGFIVLAMIMMELLRARGSAEATEAAAGAAPSGATRAIGVAALGAWGAAIIAGRLTAYPNFVTSLLGL